MGSYKSIIAAIIGIGTVVGTAFTVDSRYAKSAEVDSISAYIASVDDRLDIKILKDRADALQSRMWKLEDRYGMDIAKMPDDVREQYRELKKEFDEIMEKIKGKAPNGASNS